MSARHSPAEVRALIIRASKATNSLLMEQTANHYNPPAWFALADKIADINCLVQWRDWVSLERLLKDLDGETVDLATPDPAEADPFDPDKTEIIEVRAVEDPSPVEDEQR